MARASSVAVGLAFALAAAVAGPVLWLVLEPALGGRIAVGLTFTALASAYAAVVGWRARQDPVLCWSAIVGVGMAGFFTALAGGSLGTVAVIVTACLGIVRSGFAHELRPTRALLIEGTLGAVALAFGRFLLLPYAGPLSLAAAAWGYFLVQSLYGLAGGIAARRPRAERDPFERARAALAELLEEA